jgi:hypothetical protein
MYMGFNSMDIREKMQMKKNILKCIHICGGLTGKFAKKMCDDDTVYQELMEDGQIRRIPVEVKMSDKTNKKMYLYELSSKQKAAKFPSMKEDEARSIALMNACYCTYQHSEWIEQDDIKRLVSATDIKRDKLMPKLMMYQENQLCAVYIHNANSKLTDMEKQIISEQLAVEQVFEYLY